MKSTSWFSYGFIFAILLSSCQPESAKRKSGELTITDHVRDYYADLPWHQRPLRIVQIVLREPDAKDYQVESLIDYLEKSAANVLVINGGGIVDFFQNRLPASNINKFLDGRDLLGEILAACHSHNIKVIARVDFRGVEKHVYDQFPDWFARNEDGSPKMLDYTRPRLYSACYNGSYRNQHAVSFINYLMDNYDVDGIWHNSIGVQGICYCDDCQSLYRQEQGGELPTPGSSPTPELRKYMRWKAEKADQHMSKMKEAVKAYGEEKVYTAEVFGMFDTEPLVYSGIDLYNAQEHFDFLVSVAFLRPNREGFEYEDLGYASSITKFLKSLDPAKESIILWGGNGTAHRYVMEPPLDSRVWLHEALASGGRFWNCNFTGQNPAMTYDRRNAFVTSDIYEMVQHRQEILTQQVPVADVGIFYSNLSRVNYDLFQDGDSPFGLAIKGIEQVLRENHYQYTFLPDKDLTAEALSNFKVIVLPNVGLMSNTHVALLKEYVEAGGKLLATYKTSLYDEKGERRDDFGLSEVFGCSFSGQTMDTNKDCYQKVLHRGDLTAGFEQTDLIVNAGNTLLCSPDPSGRTTTICSYIPRVHNQPPEKAWIDGMDSEFATMLWTAHGKGEVIYFSNQPDKYAYQGGHDDFRNILNNSFQQLLPRPIIRTNAPESVHISLTSSSDNSLYILSLVNHTSAPVRPLRSLIPVHDISVKVDLSNQQFLGYEVLKSDGTIAVSHEGGMEIQLEALKEYSSIGLLME